MMQLDEKIKEIKLRIIERDQLEKRLNRAKEENQVLENKKEELSKKLKKEASDVEKLEKMSFSNFYHSLIGDKSEKLDQEKKEAFDAKSQYDSTLYMYNASLSEIESLERRLTQYYRLEEAYKECLLEKEDLMTTQKLMGYDKLIKINEQMVEKESQLKEIDEAISAGQSLRSALDDVMSSLKSAGGWGTYDILGGGLIATMAKHSHLDEAKRKVDHAQYQLGKFNRELKDVGEIVHIQIEISSFLKFADYFFDGFFADLSVQSKINNAKAQVTASIEKVVDVLSQLSNSKYELKRQLEHFSNEKKAHIENA